MLKTYVATFLGVSALFSTLSCSTSPRSTPHRGPASDDYQVVSKPEEISYLSSGKTYQARIHADLNKLKLREGEEFGYGRRNVLLVKTPDTSTSDLLEVGRLASPLVFKLRDGSGNTKTLTIPADGVGAPVRIGISSNSEVSEPEKVSFYIGDRAALELE